MFRFFNRSGKNGNAESVRLNTADDTARTLFSNELPEFGLIEEPLEWTGIPGLNNLVHGGIPTGRILLVASHGGADTTHLAEQFLWKGLMHEDSCLYAVSREPPSHVRERMRSRAWDITAYESEGSMIWVDCFSSTLPNPPKEEHVIVADSLESLPEIRLAIKRGLKKLSSGSKRMVMDVLSVLIERHGIKPVFAVTQEIIARLKEQHVSTIMLIDADMHDEKDVSRIAHLCDGVIKLRQVHEVKNENHMQRMYLRIETLRGLQYDSTAVPLSRDGDMLVAVQQS